MIAQEKWLKEVTEAPGKTLQRLLETWLRATPEDQIYLLEAILRQYGRTQSNSPQLYEILKSVVQDPSRLFEQDNPVMVLEAYLSNPSVNTDEAKAALVNINGHKGRIWEDLISLVRRDLLPPVEFSIHYRIERILDTDSEGERSRGFLAQTGEISESPPDTPSVWSLPVEVLFGKFFTEVWDGNSFRLSNIGPCLEIHINKSEDDSLLRKISMPLYRHLNHIMYFNNEDDVPEGWTEENWNRYVEENGYWLTTLSLRDPMGEYLDLRYSRRGPDGSSYPYLRTVLSWAHEEGVI